MTIGRRLALLLVSSLVFAVLYYFARDLYRAVVVALAGGMANLFVPVTLVPHPMGLVITAAAATDPIGVPYDVYAIGMNVMFAPALVLATMGLTVSGAWRAVVSVAVMIGLHAIELASIAFFYLAHPDNAVFDGQFSDVASALIVWIYHFLDTMSYVLFPFAAWLLVCPTVIATLFRDSHPPVEVDATRPKR